MSRECLCNGLDFFFLEYLNIYICVIDQAFLWTKTKSRSIKTQKRTRPISSHLDRTNLVNKGFIIWPKDYAKRLLLLRDQSRAGKIGPSCSGSQSEYRIHFILPARRASHIIKYIITIKMFSLTSLLCCKSGNSCTTV